MLIKKIKLNDLRKVGAYIKNKEKYALIFIEKDMQDKIDNMIREIANIKKIDLKYIFILERDDIELNCKTKQILNPNEVQYPSYYIFEQNKEIPIFFKVNILKKIKEKIC
jgi:uncharacterized protein YlbG (UPF0298 family)